MADIPKTFKNCYIEDPRILAEQVLNDGIFNGSITFPFVDNTKSDAEPDIYTVPFIMENEFGFSLGNDWGTIVSEVGQTLGAFLSEQANLASFAGMGSSQVSLISKAMSAASWKGSKIPQFTINVAFVATRRSYNPVEIIKALSATCLPLALKDYPNHPIQDIKKSIADKVEDAGDWFQKAGSKVSQEEHPVVSGVLQSLTTLSNAVAKGVKNSGLIAPLFYEPEIDLNNDAVNVSDACTVSLQIGQWFRAPKLIVESVDSIQFSKETIAPQPDWLYQDSGNALYHKNLTQLEKQGDWGFPLYAKCSITLRPTTYITYPEFLSYFPQCPHKPDNNFTINDSVDDIENNYVTNNTIINESYGTWYNQPTSTTEIFNSKYSSFGINTYDSI